VGGLLEHHARDPRCLAGHRAALRTERAGLIVTSNKPFSGRDESRRLGTSGGRQRDWDQEGSEETGLRGRPAGRGDPDGSRRRSVLTTAVVRLTGAPITPGRPGRALAHGMSTVLPERLVRLPRPLRAVPGRGCGSSRPACRPTGARRRRTGQPTCSRTRARPRSSNLDDDGASVAGHPTSGGSPATPARAAVNDATALLAVLGVIRPAGKRSTAFARARIAGTGGRRLRESLACRLARRKARSLPVLLTTAICIPAASAHPPAPERKGLEDATTT
jgi:hypothetical protein